MKDVSGAMNQTISGAMNGWLYPPPNGNKHKLIPLRQRRTVSQQGTCTAALLVHHLHFTSSSELKQKWCNTAGGLVIDYWQIHWSALEGDRNIASIFFSLDLYRINKERCLMLVKRDNFIGDVFICLIHTRVKERQSFEIMFSNFFY